MNRSDLISLVETLRTNATIIEQCQDSQEFEEAIADVRAALNKVSPSTAERDL